MIEDLRLLNLQGFLRGNEPGQPLKNLCRWLNRGVLPSAASNLRKDPTLFANEAKMKYLGVSEEVLRDHGAVSFECAHQMALGVTSQMDAEVGLATTGIAGPGGGTAEKPVGLVYIGCSICGDVSVEEYHFSGTREQIRNRTVEEALTLLVKRLENN